MLRRWSCIAVFLLAGAICVLAVNHKVNFGQTMNVQLFVGPEETRTQPMEIRSLQVDGNVKEFVTGLPHDVTIETFVIRRAYRINDARSEDPGVKPVWKWTRGGWLKVDRESGRITRLNMPDFDPFFSVAAWYRDYVAYCGSSSDGEKLIAVVRQLGAAKPLLSMPLGKVRQAGDPDSECELPVWEKISTPYKVTFQPKGGERVSFSIRGRNGEIDATGESEEKQ